MRFGLKIFATAQSSLGGQLVKQRGKFAADDVCPLRAERVSVRSLLEDSHRTVTQGCCSCIAHSAEIIINATRTREVLGEKNRWSSRLLCRFPECSVEPLCGDDRASCTSRDGEGRILAIQTSVSMASRVAR